ncbi:hypothetical protein AKO1_004395 [Acrasis kona]|uniref:Protein kinase domain-containing protein n=1 Tax=Acrasis kona TaxID=1008807 RepID=A0AAW2YQX0_9EUKA
MNNKNLRLEIKAITSQPTLQKKHTSQQVNMSPTTTNTLPTTTNTTIINDNPTFMWQPGRELGRGAYGVVYEAMNVETGKFMAVKKIQIKSKQRDKLIQETMQEIKVMKQLKHENIVQYLGVDRDQDTLYIFLELVAGGSIASLLGVFKMFHESVVRLYIRQILMGLSYLHSHQIVHRDIKAANILVNHNGVVKLADFGHSKVLNPNESQANKSIRGTPMWMAPEVIRENKHGKWSDIWALGCTLIEMITGDYPWPRLAKQEPMAIMYNIATLGKCPKIPKNLSPDGKIFLKRCFVLDPKQRATVDELLKEPFVTNQLDPWAPIPCTSDSDEEEDDDEEEDEEEEEEEDEDDEEEDGTEEEEEDEYDEEEEEFATEDEEDKAKMESTTQHGVNKKISHATTTPGQPRDLSYLRRSTKSNVANVQDILQYLTDKRRNTSSIGGSSSTLNKGRGHV